MKHQTHSYPDFLSEKVFRVFYFARTQLQMAEKLNAEKKEKWKTFHFSIPIIYRGSSETERKVICDDGKDPNFWYEPQQLPADTVCVCV